MCLTCVPKETIDTSETAATPEVRAVKIEGRPISRRSEFSYQRQENGPRSIKLPFIKEPNKSTALKRLGVTLVRVNLAFINPFRK